MAPVIFAFIPFGSGSRSRSLDPFLDLIPIFLRFGSLLDPDPILLRLDPGVSEPGAYKRKDLPSVEMNTKEKIQAERETHSFAGVQNSSLLPETFRRSWIFDCFQFHSTQKGVRQNPRNSPDI